VIICNYLIIVHLFRYRKNIALDSWQRNSCASQCGSERLRLSSFVSWTPNRKEQRGCHWQSHPFKYYLSAFIFMRKKLPLQRRERRDNERKVPRARSFPTRRWPVPQERSPSFFSISLNSSLPGYFWVSLLLSSFVSCPCFLSASLSLSFSRSLSVSFFR